MADRKCLTAAQILAADPPSVESIDVPEWGGAVTLRALSGFDRLLMAEKLVSRPESNADNLRNMAVLLSWAIADEQGNPLFEPGGADAVNALARKNADVLVRLGTHALRMNGLSTDSLDEAEGN